MADTFNAQSPLDKANQRIKDRTKDLMSGAGQRAQRPSQPDLSTYDAISRHYQVPQNVIEAFSEAANLQNEGDTMRFAADFAGRMGEQMQSGLDVPGSLKAILGKDAPINGVLERAVQISRERDPEYDRRLSGKTTAAERPGNFFTDMWSGALSSAGAATSAFGFDETADKLNAKAEKYAPPIGSYKEVDTLGEAVRYVSGGIAQSIPEMLAVFGAGLAVAASGGTVLLAGGAALGTSTLFNAGRAAERQAEENAGDVDYARAWGAGAAMGLLDAVVPGKIAGKVAGAFSTRFAGAMAVGASKHGIGREILVNAGTEGVTEVLQQVIEFTQANPDLIRILVNPSDGEYEKSDQLLTELIDSAIIGSLAGGAFSAGGAGVKAAADRMGGESGNDEPVADNPQPLPTDDSMAQDAGFQAKETLDPVEEAPAPSGPISRAAAKAPEPLAAHVPTGSRVRIYTGDGAAVEATFVEEKADGVMFDGGDYGPLMVTRDDLTNGRAAFSVIGPEVEQQTQADQQGPAEAESKPVTVDEIWSRIQAGETTEIDGGEPSQFMAVAKAIHDYGGVLAKEDLNALNVDVESAQSANDLNEIVTFWVAHTQGLTEARPEQETPTETLGQVPEKYAPVENKETIEDLLPKAQDTRSSMEREFAVNQAVGQALNELRIPQLTDKEKARVLSLLDADGGDPREVIADVLSRPDALDDETIAETKPEDAAETADMASVPQSTEVMGQGATADTPSAEVAPAPQVEQSTPMIAALKQGIERGEVTHITKRQKELTGYIIHEVDGLRLTPKAAKEIDKYAFRKDGGWFMRKDDVDTYLSVEGGEVLEGAAPETTAVDNSQNDAQKSDGNYGQKQEDAKTPVKPRKTTKPASADRPLDDYSGKEVNGYGEGGVHEDGRDATIKKAFLDDASRYARKVASILKKEHGFTDPEGKTKTVRINTGGMAGSGDVYLNLVSPDGSLEVSLRIEADTFMAGPNNVFMNLQHRTDGQFVGSNTYPDTTATPAEMAEIIKAATERKRAEADRMEAAKAKPKEEAAPTASNDPAFKAANLSGRLEVVHVTADTVEAAAAEADTNPTEAQKEAGNYKKGHISWNGLDLTIENPKGSERSGTDSDGEAWSVTMPAHYGYIKLTEGADGDHVDFYMGDNPESNTVVIVNQMDPKTGKFDEHKVVLGANDVNEALAIYRKGFSDGSGDSRIQSHSATDVDSFKGWLKDQDTTKPAEKANAPDQGDVETKADNVSDITDFTEALTSKSGTAVFNGIEYQMHETKDRGWRVNTRQQSPYKVGSIESVPGQDWTREQAIEQAQRKVFPDAFKVDGKSENEPPTDILNRVITEDNKDAEGYYVSGSITVEIDFHPDHEAEFTITQSVSRYSGRTKKTEERRKRVKYTHVKGELTADVRSVVDAIVAKETQQPDAETQTKPEYGSENKLVSRDRAEELRARLKDKLRNQLNSGIDPEILAIGAELAVFHIEAGARKFAKFAQAIADDLGTTTVKLRPYLRSWYNGARDMMEDNGLSIEGMDNPTEVREALAKLNDAPTSKPEPENQAQSTQPKQSDMFADVPSEEKADDNRNHDSNGGTRAEKDAGSAKARPARELRSETGGERGAGSEPSKRAAERSEPVVDGTGNRNGERSGSSLVEPRARNHVIPAGGLDLARGEKTRARESVAAIKTLRELEASGLHATEEQLDILAKYGGAGTLAGALPRSDGSYKFPDIAEELKTLLNEEELATLSRTSQYAFYTAESALRGMWRLAERLGFKGGRVYEPGMGVGGFAGTIPESIRRDTSYEGLELDHITAAIAKKLYPAHKIKQGDFIKARLPQNYYDLVIGNPPFSGTRIEADKDYPQRFMLHDYFFAKSLDSVRPGGLLIFISSAGTMNKLDSKARDYLADQADLVGAIRLPNTAFKENGTEVTTDIIVLRKRLEGEIEASPAWRNADSVELPREDGSTGHAAVNQYFIDNPDMILGEQGLYDTLTAGDRVGVRPRPNSDLAHDLQKLVSEHFSENIVSEVSDDVKLDAVDTDSAEKKTGSYYLDEKGNLHQFDGRVGQPVQQRGKGVKGGKSKAEIEMIKALIPLKDALRDVYALDLKGEDAGKARRALNKAYDTFVKEHGPIGKQVRSFRRPSAIEMEGLRQQALQDARAAGEDFDIGSFDPSPLIDRPTDPETGEAQKPASMREIAAARKAAMAETDYQEGTFNPDEVPDKVVVKRPNIDPFMDDPESYRLLAIERYNEKDDTAEKTLVFTESTVSRSTKPTINSPEDALLYLLAETGRVDLNRIAEMSGSDAATVRRELGEKIFRNPATSQYETRSKYLSGNVRIKLEEAQKAALTNSDYAINVEALTAIQPDPVTAEEIRVPIGASWFPAETYSEFASELGLTLKAEFTPVLGQWKVISGDRNSQAAKNEFGTEDKPFADLMQLILNNKKIEVTRKDSDGKQFVDEEATQAAKDKAKELQEKFSEWFWAEEARTASMEDLYNKTFNAEVAPSYDGGYLTTPGINSAWSWRPHQTAVIARILQSGSTYMAHTVGAGKTSAMIGAGMEARRLGLSQKPMYVVPNHMLVQFATEFYQQYPLAKILVADERRFHTSKRKQFIADAAMGDWDAIIITHSGFEKIPPSEASVNRVVEKMLNDIKEAFNEMQEGGGQAQERGVLGALGSMASMLGLSVPKEKGLSTRKKIEQLIEAAEQRMSRQIDRRDQDQVFNFDELGVDMLFVDEAHLFRKLSFATTNSDIKGVDPQGSNKSMDLFIKARALDEINPGRGLVLASGTPITNTMAELYSISRYLQPQALERRGVSAFDGWAATFGSVEAELEQLPDGGYKSVARFSKFVNTPELSLMVRQVMDVITGADLEQYVTRPKLKGGKRNLVLVEPTDEVKDFQQTLAARMDAIAARKGPVKKGDDILLSVINDGRLSAIDPRLVNPQASGDGSKLEAMIQNIFDVWRSGKKAPLHGVKPEGGYTDKPIEHGPSTQIVFSTLGVNPSKHNPNFSVHRHVKAALIRMGVPAKEIILVDDLKTDALKQRAFNDMNEGKKRILIGSQKLFTGVNAQRRMAAIHNLDPLWFPADDEQRNGRGLRQGNMNPEIQIFDYSTKGTYDATMWQMMGRKAAFIEGFFRGDPNMREMEDLGEASQYQQATALSTRDPRVLELTELRQERDELDRRRGAIERQKRRLASIVRSNRSAVENQKARLVKWEEAAAKVEDLKGDKFKGYVEGAEHTERKTFGQALIDIMVAAEENPKGMKDVDVARISGFTLRYTFSKFVDAHFFDLYAFGDERISIDGTFDPVGMARRVEGAVQSIEKAREGTEIRIAMLSKEADDAEAQLSKVKPFGQTQELRLIEEKIDTLEAEMLADSEAQQKAREEAKEKRNSQPQPRSGLKVDVQSVRRLKKRILSELKAAGLGDDIHLKLHDGDIKKDRGYSIDGYFIADVIGVSADAADPLAVARHEIIHALRSSALWGRDGGLFEKAEWQALVREARKNKDLLEKTKALYPHLPQSALIEEVVADLYAEWAKKQDTSTVAGRAFGKLRRIFDAIISALKGEGAVIAAQVFEDIRAGHIGRRGKAIGTDTQPMKAKRRKKQAGPEGFEGAPLVPAGSYKEGATKLINNALTNAMKGNFSLLALVPGRPLISELAGTIPAAQKYLRLKERMDTLRNDLHLQMDEIAQKWRKIGSQDRDANNAMMALMHEATIKGQDPSEAFKPVAQPRDGELVMKYGPNTKTHQDARSRIEQDKVNKAIWEELRRKYLALPKEFQDMFVTVRDAYTEQADAFEKAVEEQAGKAMNVAVRRAKRDYNKRLDEIRDDGLTGDEKREAIQEAEKEFANVKLRAAMAKNARLSQLRSRFEDNRLSGPYFPLARFGDLFVTLRDEDGKVVSYSQFEDVADQKAYAADMRKEGYDVQEGVVKESSPRDSVDPGFVADVEALLQEISADEQVMDAIWQRWLQTLPDMSVRKSRLHRKGRAGYDRDAFRAFGKQMFHGAHQLARLKYSLDMGEELEDARDQAANSAKPVRNTLIVDEISRRHDYVMNPKGAAWAQHITSAAFVYYLGMTPAAALVNLSQTTVVGIPILGAFYGKNGTRKAASELMKAMGDFTRGRGHAANSKRLSVEERKAIQAAYEMGTIDKSQSHDLAGVGETGVEYSALRTKVMGGIAWMFHNAERVNREVTFLAAYRIARAKNLGHEAAIHKAADLTWKTHFDYANTSRPRFLQNDAFRVAMVFRNFQINMLWRLFRDTHQMFNAEDPEVKKEARRQLTGITAQMLLHAGVKGVWGYSLLMMLVGTLFDGGSDEAEKEMEKALHAFLPRDMVGMILNGVPGHLTGADLSARMGMPDLWFRSNDRALEGEDEYQYYVNQMLGATFGIGENLARGLWQIGEGEIWRGVETILPKAIRDVMRGGRYMYEGALTYNDDALVDKFTAAELFGQVMGFTPARLAERYDANTRMKNEEKRIVDARRAIMRDAGMAVLAGKEIPRSVLDAMEDFNRKHPEYPIDSKSLNQSIRSRQRSHDRNEFGIQLNPRLNRSIRDGQAPLVYD